MADSSSSATEITDSSSTALPIPPQLKFVMANIRSIVSIQLTAENYSLWSSQVLKLVKANGYESFLTGSSPCPPESQLTATGLLSSNPTYQQWQLVDQNLFAALSATISPSILPYVLSLNTTADMWETLAKRLQASNRSRVIQLKNELHHISLKNNTITQYLSEVKALVDQIAAAGSTIDNEDVILYILNGLPASYQAFKTAIRVRAGALNLDDLYSLLISEEITIAADLNRQHTLPPTALYAHRGRGRGSYGRGGPPSRGRGRSQQQPTPQVDFRSSTSAPTNRTATSPSGGYRTLPCCQICNKIGHIAANCWHRTNLEVSPPIHTPSVRHT